MLSYLEMIILYSLSSTTLLSILLTTYALNILNCIASELAQRRPADRADDETAASMQDNSLHFASFPPTIQLIFVSTNIAKGKSEAPAKAADEKADKKPRKKKDANAPKKPVCAFFWYQRDPKNAITDPAIQSHKDRIRVSAFIASTASSGIFWRSPELDPTQLA